MGKQIAVLIAQTRFRGILSSSVSVLQVCALLHMHVEQDASAYALPHELGVHV